MVFAAGTIVGGILGNSAHDLTKYIFTKILEKISFVRPPAINEIISLLINILTGLTDIERLAHNIRDFMQHLNDQLSHIYPNVKTKLQFTRSGSRIRLDVSYEIDLGESMIETDRYDNPFVLELSSDEESGPLSDAASPVSTPGGD